MRILFVSHFFPPQRNAGTENYTLGLAQAMASRGHRVHVLCAGDWERGEHYWNGVTEDSHGGVPVSRVNLNWMRATDPNQVLYASADVKNWFGGWLRGQKPDVVHVTSASTLGVGVLEVPHRDGIPVVLTLMDFWFICARTLLIRGDGELCDGRTTPSDCLHCLLSTSNIYRKLNPWIPDRLKPAVWDTGAAVPWLARARGMRGMALDMRHRKEALREALTWPAVILSHSRFVQQMTAQAGLSDRVRHLANGHELRWLRTYAGKGESAVLRVGYMGQLIETKGVHTLIEAFRRAGLGNRARLDIWGNTALDRAYAETLRALIAGQPGIALRGGYGRDDLARILADMDVLVVPSTWYENAPLVIQEAFAAETPVITTNLGGMSEAVTHDVNGLLFQRNDVEDLARQLRRAADEPGLLQRLAAGIPRVKSVEEEAGEVEAIYRDVASAR